MRSARLKTLITSNHSKEATEMSAHATASFTVKSWDEKPYNEIEGAPKLTRASVTYSYQGEIEGEGASESLMVYRDDGSASFVGLERVVGRIGGRSGSFVLQASGTYDQSTGTARGALVVAPGSGAGELRGLRGKGEFVATHEPPGSITLDYDFE